MCSNWSRALRASASISRPSSTVSGIRWICGFQVRFGLHEFTQPEARHPLHQQADGAIRGAEQAVHHGDRAHLVQVFRLGDFQLGIARGDQPDQAVISCHHIIHQADRARLSDGQRNSRLRINHQAAQRQDGQDSREFWIRLELLIADGLAGKICSLPGVCDRWLENSCCR